MSATMSANSECASVMQGRHLDCQGFVCFPNEQCVTLASNGDAVD